jgi:hypothetical protein
MQKLLPAGFNSNQWMQAMRPLKEGLPGFIGISSLTRKLLLAGFPNTRFRCKSSFICGTVQMHSKGLHESPELLFASIRFMVS